MEFGSLCEATPWEACLHGIKTAVLMADYEVELKFRLPSPADGLKKQLLAIQAVSLGERTQEDIYFRHPVRDFATTDEALRIRRDGDRNAMTYKGPLLDTQSKTRQEIEIDFDSGSHAAEQMWALLRALGFRDVRRIHKLRQLYSLTWQERRFQVGIDQVERLGLFVELESMATDQDWQVARDSALALARQLNLADSERKSYLELLLEQDAANQS